MVAIGGVVSLPDSLKQTHQSIDSVAIVTKLSVAIKAPDADGEMVANAFRVAMTARTALSSSHWPRMCKAPRPKPLFRIAAAARARACSHAHDPQGCRQNIEGEDPGHLLGMGALEPRATSAVRARLKRPPCRHSGLSKAREGFAPVGCFVLRTRELSEINRETKCGPGRMWSYSQATILSRTLRVSGMLARGEPSFIWIVIPAMLIIATSLNWSFAEESLRHCSTLTSRPEEHFVRRTVRPAGHLAEWTALQTRPLESRADRTIR